MICINCQHEHEEKCCPMCGEPAETPKITFKTISSELLATVAYMDKGFLYNVKQLLLHPQKLVQDYLRGKRKTIFNPATFLLIAVSLYLIVDSLIPSTGISTEERRAGYSLGYLAGQFIRNYFKYFWILSILWLSTSTWLVFRRYNFAEHLVISSFIIGQGTLVGLFGLPFGKLPVMMNPVFFAFSGWMIYRIFKGSDTTFSTILESLGALLLFVLQLLVIVLLVGWINMKLAAG